MSADRVRVELDGSVATIINDNPEKRNAFDDEMDECLFEIFGELRTHPEVRAVVWRAEGEVWSSGRDVSAIGKNVTDLTHHELMLRGHRGILQLFDLDAPVIAALKGWVIGGSFQRALLCDMRIATKDTRFMLPELKYGVIPDTGGVSRLYQMCGHGVVSDMVLCGRVLDVIEAKELGIISRIVEDDEELNQTAFEMARSIASSPTIAVKLARRVIHHLSEPTVRASMDDELIYQTFLNRSDDFAEFKNSRTEGRVPTYRGS